MRTNLSILLISILLIGSCISKSDKSNKTARKFSLKGNIIGQDSGKIVLTYIPYSDLIQDTAEMENGEFVFTGMISEPTRAQINGGNDLNRTDIYLEPGVVKVILTKDNFKEFKVIGSKTQEEEFVLHKMLEPTNKLLSANRKQLFNIYDSIKKSTDEVKKSLLEKKYEEIRILLSQENEELAEIQIGFIISHPKSYVSPYYLSILGGNEVISLDSLKSIFSGLDISVQNSKHGNYIKDNIRKKENTLVGAIAPDFRAIDLNNQVVSLSAFKGKFVVLEFWASWCVPCRESIPYLKNLYRTYNSHGLEIIAISFADFNRETWITAIDKDSINMWHNIATIFQNGEEINKEITENFLIPPIPLTILIDKDGRVMDSWRGYSKEKEESLDRKLAEIFNN